jgi:mxaJ protein
MCSPSRTSDRCGRGRGLLAAALLAAALGGCTAGQAEPARELRVCSDPNNLPFSNEAEEGFENRIADLIAAELGAELQYTWWAQRRGFFRNTLRAGLCDLVIGVPSSFELAHPTRPYYRSTYVFVYPQGRGLDIRSFDDPALRDLRIGVHIIGDDYNNTPPAQALAERGFAGRVKGYSIYGNYAEPNPPARIFDGLLNDEIDVAIVWGPLAGYFAPRQAMALEIVPVSPQIDLPYLPFVFDISLGVRRGDAELHAELDALLVRRREEIGRILDEYGVPQVGRTRAVARPTGGVHD